MQKIYLSPRQRNLLGIKDKFYTVSSELYKESKVIEENEPDYTKLEKEGNIIIKEWKHQPG